MYDSFTGIDSPHNDVMLSVMNKYIHFTIRIKPVFNYHVIFFSQTLCLIIIHL